MKLSMHWDDYQKAWVCDQSIPSPLFKPYKAALTEARQIRGGWYGIKRTAFKAYGRRGLKILGLGLRDEFNRTTRPQGEGRRLWNACIDCWHQQPLTGGVPWGDYGVYNRSVWYEKALEQGEQAYRYFMKLTRKDLHRDTTPIWWARYPYAQSNPEEANPNEAFDNYSASSLLISQGSGNKHIIFKKPLGMNYLYFYLIDVYYDDEREEDYEIRFAKLPLDPWLIPPTWADYHAWVENDDYEFYKIKGITTGEGAPWALKWFKIQVPTCESVGVYLSAPPPDEWGYVTGEFMGVGQDCVPTLASFWTDKGDLPLSALVQNPFWP